MAAALVAAGLVLNLGYDEHTWSAVAYVAGALLAVGAGQVRRRRQAGRR